jgi:uncharacterized Fe-S radical SAM superfamily protein PflX
VGLPTRGFKKLVVDESDCKKLDRSDIHRLFKAANRLVLTELRNKQRPWRYQATLARVYYTRLTGSELVALRRDQHDGRYLLTPSARGCAALLYGCNLCSRRCTVGRGQMGAHSVLMGSFLGQAERAALLILESIS